MHRGGRLTEYDLDPRYRGPAFAPVVSGGGVAALPAANGGGPAPGFAAAGAPSPALALPGPSGASLSMEENERRLLREALLKARGNRTKAAELMGISRRTLHRKLVQWPELDTVD